MSFSAIASAALFAVLPTLTLSTPVTICLADQSQRVLIVTGEDKHHDWRRTTPVLMELLHRDPRLTVDVLSDLRALKTFDLTPYAVVVIHFKNEDPNVPGRKAFDKIRRFVDEGGGLVLVHFACGAFTEFKLDYTQLVGRVWFGPDLPPGGRNHDRRGPFVVNITSKSHPVVAGLTDFETDDELYTCLEGDVPIEVVATATSKVDGKPHPMALLYQYGQGRVFNCTLGHDVRALRVETVGELYRRGCAWTAKLAPVPKIKKKAARR